MPSLLPRRTAWRPHLFVAATLFLVASGSLFAAKVRLPADSAFARSQAFPGIDYGSFRVVEVDDATADAWVAAGEGEKIVDADRVFLNAGTVDTSQPAARSLRRAAGAFPGKRLHLVEFAGPIKQEWVDALTADGLRVVTYLPNHAYLVWGEARAVARLQARAADPVVSAVQWEAAWQDEWKLAPSVLGNAEQSVAEMLSVQLVADEEANAATLDALRAAGAYFLREPWTAPGYLNFAVQLAPSALGALTARPDVVSIHRYAEPRLLDESQAMVLAGALTGNAPSPGSYLARLAGWGFTQAQFDASGLAVDVSDEGLDNGTTTPNHFSLYKNGDKTQASRLIYRRVINGNDGPDAGQGNAGHGQLNTSIIGGHVPDTSVTVNGNTTPTTTFPHADAQGFRYGLGVAPFVKLGNSTIFDPSFLSPNYTILQASAYAAGARVSSNSWGLTATGAPYNSTAQAYDFLVRDTQESSVPGNQQMVIVFSAGNSGSGASTVASPGTGKNVITVGAAEGVRSLALAAGGLDAAGADGCGIPDGNADSADDLAAFSSRGPCADGRVKPDLVAGGTHVTGMTYVTASSSGNGTAAATFRASDLCALPGNTGATGQAADFFPTVNSGPPPYNQAQQWWTTSTGTSHSTPAVAGAAALVFQQFINNPAYLGDNRTPAGSAPPGAALVKAYLVNGARYLPGAGANDALPSNAQGMGHANLGTAFDGVTRVIRDESPLDRFTAAGQSRTFTGAVTNSAKPFRVTLAWTDAPGSTAGNAYVNNLDLTVTVGGNTYRGNVFAATGGLSATGGAADARNNVESVFLPAGLSGNFTVTVSAANVAGQGDRNVAGNNQDFALVIYNGNGGSGGGGTAPAITSAAPGGPVIVGSAYAHTFTATGTPAPTFAVTAGTLPPGLNLSATGVLSGTATSAGSGSFPGITVTASNGNAPAATQSFSLSAVTRAANYAASYGLTGANAALTADPNGDGVTNLLAYALGLNPTLNGSAVVDHGTVRNYNGINYFSMRFKRSSVATDLTYVVEVTSDLGSSPIVWTELARSTAGGPMTAGAGVVVGDTGGPPTYAVEVRDTVTLPPSVANPRRFLRLRVTSP